MVKPESMIAPLLKLLRCPGELGGRWRWGQGVIGAVFIWVELTRIPHVAKYPGDLHRARLMDLTAAGA